MLVDEELVADGDCEVEVDDDVIVIIANGPFLELTDYINGTKKCLLMFLALGQEFHYRSL